MPEPGNTWRFPRNHRQAVAGAVFIAALTLLCIAAPIIVSDPNAQDLSLSATPPGTRHWMGTDSLGRDVFARVLYGGRVSLALGLAATLVAVVIGVTYGAIAGYAGGMADTVMMRVVDILYALPFAIIVILLTVFFGRNLWLLFAAIGAVEWLTMARIVRGQVRALRREAFVEAAVAIGSSRRRIIFRHIVPNTFGPVIVYAALTFPSVILLESFLSFLGLGAQPPNASWGTLIGEGQKSMEEFPWLLIFPCLALVMTLLSFQFLGEGLRDALDPRAARDRTVWLPFRFRRQRLRACNKSECH